MADEDTGLTAGGGPQDHETGAAAGGDTSGNGPGDGTGQATAQPTSPEALAALREQVKNLEGIVSKANSERDKALNEARAVRDEQLAKLTELATARQTPAEDVNAAAKARSALIEKYNSGDMTGDELFGLVEGMYEDAKDSAKREAGEAWKQEVETLKTTLAAVHETLEVRDPDFVAIGADKIKAIQDEMGVDRAMAVKIAKKYVKPTQPARPQIPGGTGGGRSIESDEGDDGDVDAFAKFAEESPILGKLSDAEKAKLRAMRKQRQGG